MPASTFSPAVARFASPFEGEEAVTLKYYDSQPGKGTGPYTTLIVVHGNGYNGSIWAPWAPALSRDIRLLAYNRRGYEGSSPIYNPSHTVPGEVAGRAIADVLGFMKYAAEDLKVPAKDQATGKGGIVLMGWSRGCMVMVGVLDLLPILPSTASRFGLPPTLSAISPVVRSHLRAILLYEPPLQSVGIPPDVLPAMQVPISEQGKIFGEWMKKNVPDFCKPLLDSSFQVENVPVDTSMTLVREGDWDEAKEIAHRAMCKTPEDVGVGLIYGTKSMAYVYDAAAAFEKLLAGQTRTAVRKLDGAGHFAMATHPELFAGVIEEMIDVL